MNNLLDNTINYADHALTNDELAKLTPSVFAVEPHAKRSKKSTFVPTSDIVDALRKEGFVPFLATQMRSRQNPKHSKHMIRFRNENDDQAKDYSHELVLVNSHDGTSPYVLYAGIYRKASDTGLIVGDLVPNIKVRHNKDPIKDILEAASRLQDMFSVVDERITEMKAYNLEISEIIKLAESAVEIKYQDKPRAITAAELLVSRRRLECP